MKQFWLTINKDTFIWTKGEKGLIYNTETKVCERFHCTELLDKYIKELLVMENLYRILLSEEELSYEPVRIWVDKLLDTHSAVLTEDGTGKEIPVSLVPTLKIQNDVHMYRHAQKKYKDDSVLSNCMRLVIHLNASPHGNNDYARQTICPLKGNSETSIDMDEVKMFVHSAGTPYYLSEIILVGCVWKHERYQEMLDFLATYSMPTYIYCTEKDYMENQPYTAYDKKVHYYIIKDEYETFQPVTDANYLLIVTSESDYEKASVLTESYPDTAFRIVPIYNGKNKDFFEEYIYLTEEDVLATELSKREIFAHQSINTNHYGTLTITPDGNIHGNLNEKPLGTLKDSLYTITFRELTEGNSWLRIRDQKPCCDCIYQWLCPSPSHYEDVIGKPNLCHIKS